MPTETCGIITRNAYRSYVVVISKSKRTERYTALDTAVEGRKVQQTVESAVYALYYGEEKIRNNQHRKQRRNR